MKLEYFYLCVHTVDTVNLLSDLLLQLVVFVLQLHHSVTLGYDRSLSLCRVTLVRLVDGLSRCWVWPR